MNKVCLTCKKEFGTKDKRQKYCSIDCVYDKNSERNDIIRKQKIGTKYSDEYKKKMSKKLKGRKNVWLEGKKLSEQHKIKISLSLKGKKHNWTGYKNPEKISKMRSKKMSLSGNPNWQGGKSFELYGFEWTELLRHSIRTRDCFVCQICNRNGWVVHHIDCNKQNNDVNNLITLCNKCHIKLHNKLKNAKN